MRILWVCNIMLPAFARANHLAYSDREGWLSGSFEQIQEEKARLQTRRWDLRSSGQESLQEQTEADEALPAGSLIELGVCFPSPEGFGDFHKRLDGVEFYGFQEDLDTPEIYKPELEKRCREILDDFKPDIVHLFGTEFPHGLAMARVFQDPAHLLVGIQGICASVAEVYMADLPYKVQHRVTFRDFVRKDSLLQQQDKYRKRAETEAKTLQLTGHITGRTTFDRERTQRINPKAVYHPMNETMRSVFYKDQWKREQAELYSIFLSQGDYPLKGFHYILQAMPEILKKYPDAHLYVAGNSIIGNVGGAIAPKKYPTPVWITSYGKYLLSLIRQNGLEGRVTMLGKLNAAEMKAQFLKSHVFICPSAVENSPNSLCEAMLLGMPAVAARVGGIPDLVEDGQEGLLYSEGRPEELGAAVMRVFADDTLAGQLGENARHRAMITHNPDVNFMRLTGIYRSMM